MDLPDTPVPQHGFFVTHFLTVSDQAKSRKFYTEVLGGEVVAPENPCIKVGQASQKMIDLFERHRSSKEHDMPS